MGQRILLKGCYLNGKSVMKKAVMTMIMGAALLTFSSCGQAKNSEDAQTNVINSTDFASTTQNQSSNHILHLKNSFLNSLL